MILEVSGVFFETKVWFTINLYLLSNRKCGGNIYAL